MSGPTKQDLSIGTLDIRTVGRDFNDMSKALSISVTVVNGDSSQGTGSSRKEERSPSNEVYSRDTTYPDLSQRDSTRKGDNSKRNCKAFSLTSLGEALFRLVWPSTESVGGQREAGGSGTAEAISTSVAKESVMEVVPVEESLTMLSETQRPSFHEIYVRSLLNTGFGLPCWEPQPFPREAQSRGASPGDVGTYTTEMGFRRSFNLWKDRAAIQAMAKMYGVTGGHSNLAGGVITQCNILQQGQVVAPGASCESCPLPQSFSSQFWVVHEFHYSSVPGAILAPLASADLEATDDKEAMKEYIISHAEILYRYANRSGRLGKSEPLYIITGSIKNDAWALAAYQKYPEQDPASHRVLHLSRTTPDMTDSGASPYIWTKTPQSSLTRLGDSGVPGLKNQCLFFQGFKLAFSPRFIQRMKDDSSQPSSSAPGSAGSQEYGGPSGEPHRGPPHSGGNNTQTKGDAGHTGGSKNITLTLGTVGEVQAPSIMGDSASPTVASDILQGDPEVYHPCDTINKSLLKLAASDFALSHDDDWRHLLRSASNPESSKGAHIEADTRTVSVRNGVAFLSSPGCPTFSPLSLSAPMIEEVTRREAPAFEKAPGPQGVGHSPVKNTPVPQAESSFRELLNPKQRQGRYQLYRASHGPPLLPPPILSPRLLSRKDLGAPWMREITKNDTIFKADSKHDVVVIVMGPTGVGKSKFINSYMGEEVTAVSDGTGSCTKQITYHPQILPDTHPTCPGRRVVLIDTPGFDDTCNPPYETLRMVSVALASTYANDLRIGSVLYLNSVSQKRMFDSMRLDYQMFREICGSRTLTQVTMATTHWDSAELESPGAGNSREGEFRENFWKDILEKGATLERIEDYDSDPERIIDEILRTAQETEIRKRVLQIQEELVDKEKELTDNEAGKKLRYTLEDIKGILKQAPVQSMEEQRQAMLTVQEQLDNPETRWFGNLKSKAAFGQIKREGIRRGDLPVSDFPLN